MNSISKGDIILLEHSMFGDRHQIGRAVKDSTASTVTVVYYHRRDGWLDEEHRRTMRHVRGVIADGDVEAVSSRIEEARLELERSMTTARAAYNAVIAAEIIK